MLLDVNIKLPDGFPTKGHVRLFLPTVLDLYDDKNNGRLLLIDFEAVLEKFLRPSLANNPLVVTVMNGGLDTQPSPPCIARDARSMVL